MHVQFYSIYVDYGILTVRSLECGKTHPKTYFYFKVYSPSFSLFKGLKHCPELHVNPASCCENSLQSSHSSWETSCCGIPLLELSCPQSWTSVYAEILTRTGEAQLHHWDSAWVCLGWFCSIRASAWMVSVCVSETSIYVTLCVLTFLRPRVCEVFFFVCVMQSTCHA